MFVPAFTNAYGGFKKTDSNDGYSQTRIQLSNGSRTTSTGKVDLVRNQSWRSGKTNNPITLISGVVPWRYNSGYYRKVTDVRWIPGAFSYEQSGYRYEITGFRYPHSDITPALSGPFLTGTEMFFLDARNQARVECLLKLAQSKVNYAVYLGEAIKSADMLALRATQFAQALIWAKKIAKGGVSPREARAYRRGLNKILRRVGKDPSKEIARGYLEIKYGWLPLMNDMYNIFNETVNKLKPPLIMDASRTVTSMYSDTSTKYGASDSWSNRKANGKGYNKCQIYAQISDSFKSKAASMGLMNPLVLGWELVPFSFVVDWFMPVGNFLSALTAAAGLTFVDGFESENFEGDISCDIYRTSTGASQPECSVEVYNMRAYRTKLGGFPTPLPYVKSPFTTGNTLSALALLKVLRKT